jgi:hypothetical protein
MYLQPCYKMCRGCPYHTVEVSEDIDTSVGYHTPRWYILHRTHEPTLLTSFAFSRPGSLIAPFRFPFDKVVADCCGECATALGAALGFFDRFFVADCSIGNAWGSTSDTKPLANAGNTESSTTMRAVGGVPLYVRLLVGLFGLRELCDGSLDGCWLGTIENVLVS